MVPISHRIERRGRRSLWAVVAYGASTVVFGVSTHVLADVRVPRLAGAADAVSMVIRNLVRQLETPDAMRGRMIGVNMVFFMGGPQLGELEAGLLAQVGRRAMVGDHRRDWLSRGDRRDRRGHTGVEALHAQRGSEAMRGIFNRDVPPLTSRESNTDGAFSIARASVSSRRSSFMD